MQTQKNDHQTVTHTKPNAPYKVISQNVRSDRPAVLSHKLLWSAVLGACACVPLKAYAWGERAHSLIDSTAINALPDDGPTYLKKQVSLIADSASVPDSWRAASEPFSKMAEDPNHGWFREQSAFLKTIPRSRVAFILALYREHERLEALGSPEAKRMNVRWAGTLPYAVVEGYEHLVADMRAIREAQATGHDSSALQTDTAFMVAWMGHYVADGSQPLHVTIHHDGWVGPNPHHYTRDHNVHGRFESDYVEMINLTERDVQQHLAPLGHQSGDVFDLVLAYLAQSHRDVETVYALDQSGALKDPQNKAARHLVYERTAAAAAMLRDLVYRAWRESALPPETSAQPDPADPESPGYDSASGTVPAPRSPSLPPSVRPPPAG